MIDYTKPIKLDRAGAWRTYTGGKLIEALHGNEHGEDSNFPEEWIMSTVRARNAGRENIVEGISMVSGTDCSLADIIKENPEALLGKRHLEKFGENLGVLVKIIDSAERLTIQVHPTREKAKELFSSDYGKTECWHILGGREDSDEKPAIYLGFKEGITEEYWKEVFEKQDIDAMVSCLHKFEVEKGDTYLIQGGVPHAIGKNCLLVEVQEPTDYTIRVERITPTGLAVADFMCHQGLGFEKMFECFTYEAVSAEEAKERWCIKKQGEDIINYQNTEMFSLKEIVVSGEKTIKSEGVFSGIYVLEGSGKVAGEKVSPGSQFFLGASCSDFTIEGNLKLIQFYGPKED